MFELKKAKNNPIGILSEMFFYSYVMEAIQKGRFKLQKPNEEINSTTSVCAYILAQKWHPLIDKELIHMANRAFAESGRRISFGVVRIEPEKPQIYTLEI